jgi:hypothetical protein
MILFLAIIALGYTTVSATTPVFNLMEKSICSGDTVEMDIQVEDFTEMTSLQFSLSWDNTKMQIKDIVFVNEALADNMLFGEYDETSDVLTVSWFDQTVAGVSLDDNSLMLTVKFATTAGDNQVLSMVTFEDNPTMRELSAIENGNIEIVDGVWNNSMVMIDEPQFADVVINDDVDMAGTGSIDLTIMDGEAPYSFSWETGQTTEDIAGLAAGDYSATVTDAKGCTLSVGPFTVGSIVAVDEIPGLEAVALTPNPASNHLNLRVELAAKTTLDITIYNILGEQVRFDQIESANFALDFDLSDLATGTYFIKLQSKEGIHTEKLLLQR